MPSYLLDTCVIVDVLNGRKGRKDLLRELLRAGHTLGCCAINVAEVYAGMRPHEARATDTLLRSLDFYEITWGTAKRAGQIKFQQARRGRTLSLADTIVAAVALENSLALVTDNTKDFPIEDLELFPLRPQRR